VEENKIDVLLSEEDKTVFKLADKKYLIGKLGEGQILRIVKYVINISGKIDEIKKQFIGNKETNNLQDIINVAEVLTDEQITIIESILLSEPDTEFIKNNFNFEKLLELLALVLENNDIKAILKNAKRLKIAIEKAI